MHVELYVEPSALMQTITGTGGVVHQMVSDELIINLVRGADRDLGLNGRLIQHMRDNEPDLQLVNEMDDAQWKVFLDIRYGDSQWNRWHAKNSSNRYNIITCPHAPLSGNKSPRSDSHVAAMDIGPMSLAGKILSSISILLTIGLAYWCVRWSWHILLPKIWSWWTAVSEGHNSDGMLILTIIGAVLVPVLVTIIALSVAVVIGALFWTCCYLPCHAMHQKGCRDKKDELRNS